MFVEIATFLAGSTEPVPAKETGAEGIARKSMAYAVAPVTFKRPFVVSPVGQLPGASGLC